MAIFLILGSIFYYFRLTFKDLLTLSCAIRNCKKIILCTENSNFCIENFVLLTQVLWITIGFVLTVWGALWQSSPSYEKFLEPMTENALQSIIVMYAH
jgi:hypothetical protein